MKHLVITVMLAVVSLTAQAGVDAFKPGTVIEGYGRVAEVPGAGPVPASSQFDVAFDLREAAEADKVNRGLDTAARFLNMHAAAGVPVENMRLAVVVHGAAHRDLLSAEATGGINPNAGLIAQYPGAKIDRPISCDRRRNEAARSRSTRRCRR